MCLDSDLLFEIVGMLADLCLHVLMENGTVCGHGKIILFTYLNEKFRSLKMKRNSQHPIALFLSKVSTP